MSFNRQGALLSAVMLAALLAAVCGPIRRFTPGWQPGFLAGAGMLVALEASVVHHAFRRERMWLTEIGHYLVPELAVMLVLMRVATTLSAGARTLQADAARWLYDPLSIFDLPFLAAILAGLVIGWLAHVAMEDLFVLAPREFERPPAPDESARVTALLAEDRRQALRRVNGRFISGGVLLLICLSVEALNLEQPLGESRPISPLSAGAGLCYMVAGFLLYSQSRLSLLQARWRLDGAQVAPLVPRRWAYTSWLVVAGVAALALALPRSYGLGLLDTLRSALGVVGYAIAVVAYLLARLLSLVLLVPAWLLAMLMQGQQSPPPPELISPLEGLPPPPPAVREPQLLPALVFWLCIVLLAGYAGWIILGRHSWLGRLLDGGPLRWLRGWLALLWGDARALTRQAAELARARRERPAEPRRSVGQQHLRRLAPRELIRYFYRSTLRRAAERGLPRRSSQTPYEYRSTLASHLPDAQDAISELTDSFVAAQYSQRPIAAEEARRTHSPWQRLRRRLRHLDTE